MLSGLHRWGELGGRRKGWSHSTLSFICFRALDSPLPLIGLLLTWLSERTGPLPCHQLGLAMMVT